LLVRIGHIPQPGESVTYEGRRLTVVEMEGRRISKIRVEPVEEEVGEPGAEEQPPTG
jgi:putative hemolysin